MELKLAHMKCLDWLQKALDEITGEHLVQCEPKDEIKGHRGEIVVGVITSTETRQLLCVAYRLAAAHNELVKKHDREHELGHPDPEECAKVKKETALLRRHHTLASDLFWYAVRQELGIDGYELDIRRDWKVVTLPEEQEARADILVMYTPHPDDPFFPGSR